MSGKTKRQLEREQEAQRDKFLRDVIVCVAEDFGTNSWRQVADYRPDDGYVRILCIGDDTPGERSFFDINTDIIARGLERVLRHGFQINSAMLKSIRMAEDQDDAGYIDAYDADAIMQAGIFGEVRYG